MLTSSVTRLGEELTKRFKNNEKIKVLLCVQNAKRAETIANAFRVLVGEQRDLVSLTVICGATDIGKWIATAQGKTVYDYLIVEPAPMLTPQTVHVIREKIVPEAKVIRMACVDKQAIDYYKEKGVIVHFSIDDRDWPDLIEDMKHRA